MTSRIKQLENRIQELKTQLNQKSLWKEYLCLIGSVLLAVTSFFLIKSLWKLLNLEDLSEGYLVSFNQLLILYPIFFEYIFISLSIVCFVAIIKNGFENLKSYKENGVIGGLIFGLILGVISGLIGGLIGLIGGLIGGLIFGLILGVIGLIFGLIFGLILGVILGVIGLIFGLIFGFSGEEFLSFQERSF